LSAIGRFVIANNKLLLYVMGALVLVLSLGSLKIKLDDNFLTYFSDKFEIRRSTDFVENRLTGLNAIEWSLPAAEDGGISDPEYLQRVDNFVSWLREQPQVTNVGALSTTIKELNKSMNGDNEEFLVIPQSRELAAQYLLLYEMSLPYGLDLNNQINIDKSATRLTATLKNLSTKQTIAFEKRSQEWMANNTPSLESRGSSPTIMFSHISKRNITGMLSGTTIALVLISVILMVSLRSLKYGLLSLIPNLVPAGMAFGIWAIFNGQVGLSVSVVIAMTLGIVVDDTIHFLSKYLRAKREQGLDTPDAIRYAFNTVGEALLITTIILTAGFMILAQSTFSLNADMGLMTAITICIALFVDFFFLPPLLIWLDKRQQKPLAPDAMPEAA